MPTHPDAQPGRRDSPPEETRTDRPSDVSRESGPAGNDESGEMEASEEERGQPRDSIGYVGEQENPAVSPVDARRGRIIVVMSALLCAVLACHGLANHVMWEDEANTALFGRNVLRFGELTAWDGRNLIAYGMGSELDPRLRNTNMPPLPYYVAALGLAVFGDDTFGARILFVAFGALALLPVAYWAKRLFGRDFPWFLPSVLLALSPAYLLYIRQCRYASLSMFFTAAFFACWAGIDERKGWGTAAFTGAQLCVLLLWASNYIHAAAVTAMVPFFLVHSRFRCRRQYAFVAATLAVSLAAGVFFITKQTGAMRVPILSRLLDLPEGCRQTWIYLRDLSVFEFVPLILLGTLLAPVLFGKPAGLVRSARVAWVLAGAALVNLQVARLAGPYPLVTPVYFPPNPGHVIESAAVRYVLPLLPVGALLTAAALFVVWRLYRPLGYVVGLLLIGTNAFYLPFFTDQRPFSSTLRDYVSENARDYETGYETLLAFLRPFPAGTTVAFRPNFVTLPLQFYRPDLRHADQLTLRKDIRPEVLSELPPYLFLESSRPDVMLVLACDMTLGLLEQNRLFDESQYDFRGVIPKYWADRTRPEIPYHRFAPPPDGAAVSHLNGILVYTRKGGPRFNLTPSGPGPTSVDPDGAAQLDANARPVSSSAPAGAVRMRGSVRDPGRGGNASKDGSIR